MPFQAGIAQAVFPCTAIRALQFKLVASHVQAFEMTVVCLVLRIRLKLPYAQIYSCATLHTRVQTVNSPPPQASCLMHRIIAFLPVLWDWLSAPKSSRSRTLDGPLLTATV
jgi:hypothetical protein